jgi:uncharacterized membrane protein/uncharacterized protein (UPF0548 family)
VFERARTLVSRFAFSDGRIVVGHWRKNAHLRGRTVLLELKSLGLHFLCPVRIGEVRSEEKPDETVFGYRFDTLQGHVERGQEWFLLRKDHRTGEVSFHIEANWREGEFPAQWTRLGFALVGRRYQRAWHRLAHAHLRTAARRWEDEDRRARGQAPRDGIERRAPVQFLAQKAQKPARIRVEQEAEHMSKDARISAVALGAVAGVRSLLAPALIALEHRHRSGLFAGRRGKKAAAIAQALQLAALGELLLDKMSWAPPRVQPVSVVARAVSGAVVGAALTPRTRGLGALLGGAAAIATTWLAYNARRAATRSLGVPNVLAGLIEDAVAIGVGSRYASALR